MGKWFARKEKLRRVPVSSSIRKRAKFPMLPGGNFTNISGAAFEPKFLAKMSQGQIVIREKLFKALLYKKLSIKC